MLHNAQIKVKNYKTGAYETRPLMVSERAPGIAYGTMAGAAFAPFVLFKDIHDLELFVRGRYDIEKRKDVQYAAMGIIDDSIFG